MYLSSNSFSALHAAVLANILKIQQVKMVVLRIGEAFGWPLNIQKR